MNIALFTDTYPPFINGVSTSCYNLTKTLREHGHRVIVVTPRTTNGKLEFKDDIIYMPGIEMKNLYGYRLTRLYDKNVCKILKENNIELIHNQTDSTVGIFARRAARRLKPSRKRKQKRQRNLLITVLRTRWRLKQRNKTDWSGYYHGKLQ